MRSLLIVVALFVASVPAGAQTQAETSAAILVRLQASRPRVVPVRTTQTRQEEAMRRLRRLVVARPAAPRPTPPPKPRRRLDGTLLSNPPMVQGFTPHDWQWWYQWELHREEER